ncbi:hypothetical protein [Variovorax arabinosiphilus]|uniref:hypothetical protein n=1 Tax=Variovorax arabinosiphilus TaxID=3053498 RepID=UPI00257821C2|nr:MULTISPECIES: hypothetical protein [unclassified Variovorax]MDM0121752.1 hypothetical protein [Variovorax sp. J2L1-78]MDM0130813.1 hypothetical protein [Variovorax sp. J2L1-63]MDM0234515.1 hypothetical protein [Variovorax sp. J2R1-6]
MPSNSTTAPSIARTGLKAGAAFAVSVIQGLVLAFVLGGGVFAFYVTQLSGPGAPAARAGGAGATLALLVSPTLLVATLLLFFMPLYVMVGVAHGRRKALHKVAADHGDAMSQRLAIAIASRIEAMPRTHGALQRTADWLSVDQLCSQVAPMLGKGRAVRAVIAFVLKRLPLSEMLAEWQQARADMPDQPTPPGVDKPTDPALRELLTRRIAETLNDLGAPSRTPLYIAFAAHAALLGIGLWLVW